MRWVCLPAVLLAVTAASASVAGKANADDGLPDLVIRSVDLKATGKAIRSSRWSTLVIKNISDVRAPIVVGSPLFSVYDVED